MQLDLIRFLACIIAFGAVVAPFEAGAQRLEPESVRLANGITVVTSQRPESQVAAFHVAFRGGSRDEDNATVGAAHFMEHMFFQGTARRPNQQSILETVASRGGWINARTNFEQITFQSVVANDDFEVGLDLMADILTSSTFPSDKVENERRVVLEELNRRANDLEQMADYLLLELAYSGHPAEQLPIGNRTTVSSISREQLLAFRDRYLVAENMIVSVVSPEAHEWVVGRVEEALRDMPRGERLPRSPVPFAPSLSRNLDRSSGSARRIDAGLRVPGLNDQDFAALDVMVSILGSSGRILERTLRDELGVASDVSINSRYLTDIGLIEIDIGVRSGRLEDALDALSLLLRDQASAIPSDDDVAIAQTAIEGRLELARQSSIAQAQSLADQHSIGPAPGTAAYLAAIRSVTPADVARVSSLYVDFKKLSMVVIQPG